MSRLQGPPRSGARKRQGRCYELAGRGIIECAPESGWTLVHGTARFLRGSNLRGGHAWCENTITGRIYDAVLDQLYLRSTYYRQFGARLIRRFTVLEAATMLGKENHWGPWR